MPPGRREVEVEEGRRQDRGQSQGHQNGVDWRIQNHREVRRQLEARRRQLDRQLQPVDPAEAAHIFRSVTFWSMCPSRGLDGQLAPIDAPEDRRRHDARSNEVELRA